MTFPSLDSVEQTRSKWRNRMHSWLLAGGSVGFMAVVAWLVFGVVGLVWALALGAVGLWSATRISPKLVLNLYRARPITQQEFPDGYHVLRAITARADLPTVPMLYYVPSRMMNAFAVGMPQDSAIAVTDGLLRGLTMRQLAGVLAHEVSHIRNGDLKVMALADIVNRITSIMATVGLLTLAFYLPAILEAGGQVPWIGIVLLIFAPTIGGLLQLALSRAREYDADLDAVSLTGDPEGLAAALMALERKQGAMWEALFLPGGRLPDPSLLRSHPKTQDRVKRILALRRDQTPHIPLPGEKPEVGPSIVPVVRRPRFHVSRMGLWY
ncbi:M48 family metalloprotease [Kaustia mangrovi]|uniref:M48 family metalloprotease n=1 Tax=Kaustia mangrovi TaxID=2593653 RepID=A0A7S8C7X0_9HYPH|nr:zinc metalloprotease HtpX [Kaustia mangrovi]QPC45083.1 M48 family metalloprotease [Kaustia mangrovi]